MIRYLVIIYFTVTIVSCKEVNFKEPQPKGERSLKEVPSELRGRYLGVDPETGKIEDTLLVTDRGFQLATSLRKEKPLAEDRIFLCDTVFIRKYKGYYFVNVKHEIAWRMYVLKQEKNNDLTHMVLQPKENVSFGNFLFSLSGQITIDSVQQANDQTYYMIDPSPKQLTELIEKDYFVKFTWKRLN